MVFMDDELRFGRVKFCAEKMGVGACAERIKAINGDLLKQNIARNVTELTFDRLRLVSPFLKGAADAKRHKLEGDDAASMARRWKDEMMNRIRAFLD